MSSEVRPRSSVTAVTVVKLSGRCCGAGVRSWRARACPTARRLGRRASAEREWARRGRWVVSREVLRACEHREMLAEVWGSCCSRSSLNQQRPPVRVQARRRCGARGQRQGAMGDSRRGRLAACTRRRWCRVWWLRWEHVGAPLPQSSPHSLIRCRRRRLRLALWPSGLLTTGSIESVHHGLPSQVCYSLHIQRCCRIDPTVSSPSELLELLPWCSLFPAPSPPAT